MPPKPFVSVIVPSRNSASSIGDTIRSVLANGCAGFELIVVDDASTDGTLEAIESFSDSRIRVLRNSVPLGPAASINRAASEATGEFLFFTNADCKVSADWIEAGCRALSEESVVGVEGDIYYPVVPDSIRFKVPCNPFYHPFSKRISCPGRDFAAGNIAFRRTVFVELGGFDTTKYRFAREDTELGWRALRAGKIVHNPRMRVEHCIETWTLRSLLRNAARYEKDVLFLKEHGFFFFAWHRILHPRLTLLPLLVWKYRKMPLKDYAFLPALTLYLVAVRFFIWRGALRYRLFVV